MYLFLLLFLAITPSNFFKATLDVDRLVPRTDLGLRSDTADTSQDIPTTASYLCAEVRVMGSWGHGVMESWGHGGSLRSCGSCGVMRVMGFMGVMRGMGLCGVVGGVMGIMEGHGDHGWSWGS